VYVRKGRRQALRPSDLALDYRCVVLSGPVGTLTLFNYIEKLLLGCPSYGIDKDFKRIEDLVPLGALVVLLIFPPMIGSQGSRRILVEPSNGF
jgi:hypothetical protein